ncbi:hypothetical protein Bca4012_021135 [Brassica carinata]
MPIATGHEKEELEAELERGGCLTLTFLKVPSEQGAARIGGGGDSCLVFVQPY